MGKVEKFAVFKFVFIPEWSNISRSLRQTGRYGVRVCVCVCVCVSGGGHGGVKNLHQSKTKVGMTDLFQSVFYNFLFFVIILFSVSK